LDRLQGRSGALEQALESRIRGPLTDRLSCCKILQTKEKEDRDKNCKGNKEGFFPGQEMSTDLPAFIDLKIQLSKKSIRDFLDLFSTRKYKFNQGYSAERIVQKIQWSDEEKALGILKVWAYSSRVEEYTKEKLKKLNKIMDKEVLVALKALEESLTLRKIRDKLS